VTTSYLDLEIIYDTFLCKAATNMTMKCCYEVMPDCFHVERICISRHYGQK